MNKKNLNILFLLFFMLFLAGGVYLMKNKVPNAKNERVYTLLKAHIPYFLEKRVGGFTIISKVTGKKEKPMATEVMNRLEQLEKQWGKTHLRLELKTLYILDDNQKTIQEIVLENENEIHWIKTFFDFK